MCQTTDGHGIPLAMPHPAPGLAVDPITLMPVDEVAVTTIVDNVFDGLLPGTERVSRTSLFAGAASSPQFEAGSNVLGLRAEHGYSTMVTVRHGEETHRVLFDAGLSPDAVVDNSDRMGIDLASMTAVVLSHGHFDHAGALSTIARRLGRSRMPMVVHPNVWSRRRLTSADGAVEFPTLSRGALEAEGFEVIQRRQPSLLLGGCLLVTGEVDRTTDFERGMPPSHQAWTDGAWQADHQVVDDQALVVHVRGRGLVVVTGCGHAGVVNIVRHAMRLTGVDRLVALVGGFHLGGPYFEPAIAATVQALRDWGPSALLPGHCTGWRAQHELAQQLPEAWIAGSSGTTVTIAA